jgi:UDP-N-acetyl-D-glucosamine dehydrogenase
MKVGIIGLDADRHKLDALARGQSYVEDLGEEVLAALAGRLRPTSAYADLGSCHAVIICVPTPLTSPGGTEATDLVRL